MVVAQQFHDFFRLGRFREGREASQVAKENSDVAPMTVEHTLVSGWDDEFRDLWGKKALEASDAFILDRSVAKHPERVRHVPDFILLIILGQTCLEIAARNREHARAQGRKPGDDVAANIEPDDQRRAQQA